MTKIEKAKEFATRVHEGQVRKGSGVPYIEHPEKVAKILTDMGASEDVICAGWLHDTVEDTDVTLEQVISEFGEYVGELVAGHSEKKGIADWYEMKIKNMDFLPDSSKDLQMMVLGDKLANARDTYKDFKQKKDGVWDYLGTTVEDQAWYYGQGIKFLYRMGEYEDTKPFYDEFKNMAGEMFQGLLSVDGDMAGFVRTEEPQLYDMEHNGWSLCPVCKKHKFQQQDLKDVKGRTPCPVCGWKFDEGQALYPDAIGENQLTAEQMRMLYKEFGTTEVHWRKIEEFFKRIRRNEDER